MIAEVIVDISNSEVDKIFDYLIPSDFNISIGDRVLVPFGNRSIEGFCINIKEVSDGKYQLKPLIKTLDERPLITLEMLQLMLFMKDKFYIRYVDSLRLFIPNKLRGGKIKELKKEFLTLNPSFSLDEIYAKVGKNAKVQLEIIERLKICGEYSTSLNNQYSNSALKALREKNILESSYQTIYRSPYSELKGKNKSVILTTEQSNAVDRIFSTPLNTILLHGVTGSGKTEVYLSCIERVVSEGRSAIMLVPEISLTPQILKIFRARFGDIVAMLHSGLSDGERYDEWRRLLNGEAKIAIGARSAVFAPLENVGIIIVDEEHDQSFISESNPRYNTVDIATFRTVYNNAKLVLGSATPSVESYLKAKNQKYELIAMNKRISAHGMPKIEIIDMSKELRNGNNGIFSERLQSELQTTVSNGNQAMIFLNRRGFSSFMMCRECGYIAKCSSCDVALTYHQEDNLLKCHFCGKKYKALTLCPECSSRSIKQGKVGTERVVNEIKTLLPNVNVLRLDNDTTSTKSAYLEILGSFGAGEAQILVGTQMIAKGHDFPNVTLVGVLDADMSLYFSDYRASERTFQLITQVAGRAGRSEKEGKVLIQTFSPNHYIFNFLQRYDYVNFFDKEINTRLVTNFPPYSTIIRILVNSSDENKVLEATKEIYNECKKIKEENESDFIFMQAMKSPIAKLQNKYRYQILARVTRESEENIIKKIYGVLDRAKIKDVSVFVEINPQSMS